MDVEELFYKGDFEMKQPKIFYFCYDHQAPTGGQKQMYRHVDILNRNGYQAYAVHTIKGFRLIWFENDTKVIDWKMFNKLYSKNTDYIVLPEDLGNRILAFPGKKIIFNQNVYYGFRSFGFNKVKKYPYLDKNVKFVMTVSAHNQRYLHFIFPHIPVRRIYYGLDSKIFSYRKIEGKNKAVVLLSKKNPIDNIFLYQVISARAKQWLNRMGSYRWYFIGLNTEKEIAKILNRALIFFFPSIYEGFALLPLEAMLSGALVVTNKNGPYYEYLNNTNSFLVDTSDKLGLIKTVEAIAEKFEDNQKELTRISQKAFKTAKEYSLQREEKSLLEFWQEVFNS